MDAVKTIKDVDENTWADFKSLAAKRKQTMGSFFGTLVENYKEDENAFWEKVLHGKKFLTDNEGKEMQKKIRKMRKEFGFR